MAKPSISHSYSSHHSSPFRSGPTQRQPKKMSITQTYYLAHTARNKLAKEAARADHDLRLLVGHANLLDSLMLELANAEREQERWFNQTVSSATITSRDEPQHIRWAETIVEQAEEESDSDSDNNDDSVYDEGEDQSIQASPPLCRVPSPATIVTAQEVDSDSDSDMEDDGEEDYERLTLTRTLSRQSPPELLDDSDGDSEEDSMPPSPPQPSFDSFSEQGHPRPPPSLYPSKHSASTEVLPLSDAEDSSIFDQGYYVTARNQAPMTIQEF